MQIIFLRHGQDDDTRRGGWSRYGLLDEGKSQAQQVAAYFKNNPHYDIRQILASDLPRTMETAAYVSDALHLPIQKEPRLREINNGDLAGMPNPEALVRYPGVFFNTLNMDEPFPNGESPAQFHTRIQNWFQDILQNSPISTGDLLVVTHGGVIKVCYYLAENRPWTNQLPSYPTAKCSIHVLNPETMTFEVQNTVVWR